MNNPAVKRRRLLTLLWASTDGILLARSAAGTSPVKHVLVQCQTEESNDSNGVVVEVERRVCAVCRAGGLLAFFATGGRVVWRVLEELVRPEATDFDEVEVPWERVPRCEPSLVLMVFQQLQTSSGQIHQAVIQYVPQRQNQLFQPKKQLLLLQMRGYPQSESQD